MLASVAGHNLYYAIKNRLCHERTLLLGISDFSIKNMSLMTVCQKIMLKKLSAKHDNLERK